MSRNRRPRGRVHRENARRRQNARMESCSLHHCGGSRCDASAWNKADLQRFLAKSTARSGTEYIVVDRITTKDDGPLGQPRQVHLPPEKTFSRRPEHVVEGEGEKPAGGTEDVRGADPAIRRVMREPSTGDRYRHWQLIGACRLLCARCEPCGGIFHWTARPGAGHKLPFLAPGMANGFGFRGSGTERG